MYGEGSTMRERGGEMHRVKKQKKNLNCNEIFNPITHNTPTTHTPQSSDWQKTASAARS